jgi:hypothetical protein
MVTPVPILLLVPRLSLNTGRKEDGQLWIILLNLDNRIHVNGVAGQVTARALGLVRDETGASGSTLFVYRFPECYPASFSMRKCRAW